MATYSDVLHLPLGQAAVEATPLEEQALRGSRDAWDALIAQHNRKVFLSLLARGARPERARDICQATWLRLIDQQRQGRLRSLALPGLAIRQARFLLADEARLLRSAAPHHSLDAPDAVGVDRVAPVDQVVGCREQLRRAQKTLLRLHPNAQAVFRLTYQPPGKRPAEIASELGLSVQRVRQILCEVRSTLREDLGAHR
ncbi:MAG: sigma-70 family RNA polymerase sigma factor [Myxococcota bacterium]